MTQHSEQKYSKRSARFARAWERQFGNFGNKGGTPSAFDAWFSMIKERYPKHTFKWKWAIIQNI